MDMIDKLHMIRFDGRRSEWDRMLVKLLDANPPVVVRCEEQAKQYAAMYRDTGWNKEEFPFSRPPWKSTFFEYHMCDARDETAKRHRGASLMVELEPVNRDLMLSRLKISEASAPSAVVKLEAVTDEDTFCLFYSMIENARGELMVSRSMHLVGMRPTGEIVCAVAAVAAQIDARCPEAVYSSASLGMSLYAINFLNCKNVVRREVTQERQPSAKIRRRFAMPEVKRYTLVIDRKSSTRRDVDERVGDGDPRALHICRGHFAEYTAERPLFGKLVGRYWIPQHVRGTRAAGEVVKSYQLGESR